MGYVDVVIVGGGPAGLQAAMYVARGMRTCLLVDAGNGRNAVTGHLHSFVTHDGHTPQRLRDEAHEQLCKYEGTTIRVNGLDSQVTDVDKVEESWARFKVSFADGSSTTCRCLIMACGVKDIMPDVEGIAELWGTKIHHCPYCFGIEVKNRTIAVVSSTPEKDKMVEKVAFVSGDVTLLTNGPLELSEATQALYGKDNIKVVQKKLKKVEDCSDGIKVIFEGEENDSGVFTAIYMVPKQERNLDGVLKKLGAEIVNEPGPRMGALNLDMFNQVPSSPGLFVAGDAASPFFPPQQIATAAYTGMVCGAMAAMSIVGEEFSRGEVKHQE